MDDGSLRYVGEDGIYRFDGIRPERMSAKITPDFYQFKQPTRGESSIRWNTASDFLQGTLSQTTTAYQDGMLSLDYYGTGATLYDDFSHNDYTTTDGYGPDDLLPPFWVKPSSTTTNDAVQNQALIRNSSFVNMTTIANSFEFGEGGFYEMLWKQSSHYPAM